MNKDCLFLTLRTFSATGGIEKVCRVLSKGLNDLHENNKIGKLSVFSMYDDQSEVDPRYLPATNFKGFKQNKFQFVIESIRAGRKHKVVVLSHINLLFIGFFIKLFSPSTRVLMLAHGIEVWETPSTIKRFAISKFTKILAVSEFTRQKMLALFQLDADKIIVLNNCLDPYLQAAAKGKKNETILNKLGIQKNDIVLFTLTRLAFTERYKGYDQVLLAVKSLSIKFPQLKYVIAGKFDEREIKRVKDCIEELGIQQQVVLTGFIPEEDLADYFHLADIYVMPSKKEGFGIVFIEAMFYGLPVIGGNKDGSVDAMLNGQLGVMINPDNQEEINAAIEKVVENSSAYIPNYDLLMSHFHFNVYKNRIATIIANC
jgi:glycosyltransferase involved in cell wall biosynthesis